jgi:hypothetical protein
MNKPLTAIAIDRLKPRATRFEVPDQTLTPNGEKPLFDKTLKLPDIDAR